jgi:nitroreductase
MATGDHGLEYRPQPFDAEPVAPDEALERAEAFLEAMRRRRSIRQFSPRPVPLDVVETAIRAAATAPSGANQQPWTFVVVTDPETKRRIRYAAEHEEELLYRQRASEEYLDAIRPIGTNEVKPHITDAPVLVVVFEQAWGTNDDGSKRKHYYVRESVGIAVGILLTCLHLAGLATLTHSPSPMGFLKEILERPDNERPFVLIPVGYPAEDAEVPELSKKPFEDVAVFVE